MRLLVCGGRHFQDAPVIHHELSRLHGRLAITVLIHGGVVGTGSTAEEWARHVGIPVVRYPPNWECYGKRAERLRNDFMLADSRPTLVVAFPGGGDTADLVRRAKSAHIAVLSILSADAESRDGSMAAGSAATLSQPRFS